MPLAAREAAVEAVARWLWCQEPDGCYHERWWDDPAYEPLRAMFTERAQRILDLPAVAALSAAPGQEQGR